MPSTAPPTTGDTVGSAVVPLVVASAAFWGAVVIGAATGSPVAWAAAVAIGVAVAVTATAVGVRRSTRRAAQRDRLRAEGVPAEATIRKRTARGRINSSQIVEFELEVAVAGRSPAVAVVRATISPFDLHRIDVGAVVDVFHDRTDPTQVVLADL